MKVKDHMQAFPFIEPSDDDAVKAYHPGMTMRDEFAKAAMQGMCSNPDDGHENYDLDYNDYVQEISRCAYVMADAMMKARK
jgi:hypothetical protein